MLGQLLTGLAVVALVMTPVFAWTAVLVWATDRQLREEREQ